MRAAFAYEWMRIRTIRSTWWLSGLAVFLGVGISTLMSWGVSSELKSRGVPGNPGGIDVLGPTVVTQFAAVGRVPSLVCFVVAIIGIFAWGHEYRHGMIRASLTALTSRSALWVAKYVLVALWVAAIVFVTLVLSGVVATAFLHHYLAVFGTLTWQVIGRQVVYGVLLTWLVMAVTALTRSQAFALVAMFLWPFLVEAIVTLVFYLVPALRDHVDALRFLPFSAARQIVNVLDPGDSLLGDPLSPWGGVLVFGGLALVLMAASLVMFRKRDA